MTLVFGGPSDRPRTHAIVIGVGAYPHLSGGPGPPAADSFGLRQLSSPPVSARAFADWLLSEFRNRAAPLGSVELLLSEPVASEYEHPRLPQAIAIEAANKAAVKLAIRQWKQRADGHLENIALFYFCGHGIAKGGELALLASDFADPGGSTMENAIDLGALLLGMEACKARKQCFFIDACRNEPERLLSLATMGDNLVLDPSLELRYSQDRDYPVFYATARDYRAHGLIGAVSRFTDALLSALRGAGSDNSSGNWVVNTYSLLSGVRASLDLGNRRPGVPQQRAKSGPGEDGGFNLHYLRGEPSVPVLIACKPEVANAVGHLAVADHHSKHHYGPDECGWYLHLAASRYDLGVNFPAHEYRDASCDLHVRPPYREKEVPVEP